MSRVKIYAGKSPLDSFAAMGFDVGRRVRIKSAVRFFSRNTTSKDSVFINVDCIFDASAYILVCSNVYIGPQVSLITSTRKIGDSTQRALDNEAFPIVIGEGVWVGARAIVMPGITIAAGCIIAAGEIVTKDTEENGMYAGVPARRIKSLK